MTAFETSAAVNSDYTFLDQKDLNISPAASSRIKQWQELIQSAKYLNEQEKLIRVNNFFNQYVAYANDIDLWGVADYWATPVEFLSKGAGDCEDYSIAKYFTLKALGVAENKIRITYVRELNKQQAHMVLSYFSTPQDDPIILDNLIPKIKSANKRTDLLPIYSFNNSGLWLEQFKSKGKKMGCSNRISMWHELINRM